MTDTAADLLRAIEGYVEYRGRAHLAEMDDRFKAWLYELGAQRGDINDIKKRLAALEGKPQPDTEPEPSRGKLRLIVENGKFWLTDE